MRSVRWGWLLVGPLGLGACGAQEARGGELYVGVDGAGEVLLSPPGGSYSRRATVTLTAQPQEGWSFERWGGDAQSTTNPLTVKMRTDKDVYAFFRCDQCGGAEGPFVPGRTYMGRNQYIEYHAGDLPLIIAAPHGGYMTPDEIPDRSWGTTTADGFTEELVRQLAAAIHEATGGTPHVVICKLDRVKLDANREIEEAAQGDPEAEQAWQEFHSFLEVASADVQARWGAGLFVDLHGQSDDPDRLQLGYLLLASELRMSDAQLDAGGYAELSSVRSLSHTVEIPFSSLLRGEMSLGGLFEAAGYPAVPSPTSPDPGAEVYYSGGYNTQVHGSLEGGGIDGIQIESNMDVRESAQAREQFSAEFVLALRAYLLEHYGLELPSP